MHNKRYDSSSSSFESVLKERLKQADSKIKGFRIHLPKYSFYHSPYDYREPDSRFIARDRVKDKLASMLEYSKTNSGSYLITGYRGMGKSSMIKRVLSTLIMPGKQRINAALFSIYLFSLFFLLIHSLLMLQFYSGWIFDSSETISLTGTLYECFSLYLIPFFIIVGTILMIFRPSSPKNDPYFSNRKSISHNTHRWGKAFKHIFTKADRWEKHRVHLLKLLLSLIICVIIAWWSYKRGDIIYGFYLLVYFYIVSLISTWLIYLLYFCRSNVKDSMIVKAAKAAMQKKGFSVQLMLTIKAIKRSLYIVFNNSQIIPLFINLNIENLKELDVMRLLSRDLLSKYKFYRRRNFLYRVNSYFVVSLIFLTFLLFMNLIGNDIYSQIHTKTFISHYLPTQKMYDFKPDYSQKWDNLDTESFDDKLFEADLIDDNSLYHTILGKVDRRVQRSYEKFFFEYAPFLSFMPSSIAYMKIYLFLFYYLIMMILLIQIRRIPFGSSYTTDQVYKKLKTLNERIDSNIINSMSTDSKIQAGSYLGGISFPFAPTFSKHKVTPVMSAREIELELIEFFEMNNDLSQRMFGGPQFIIVFDEIDKIEPNIYKEEQAFSDYYDDNEYDGGRRFLTDHLRKRQELIITLLSNLKHLLTTAKARFVFIAGREMFDASLADVSDRNFFVGSIFNQIIYVDSFLSDRSNRKSSDLIGMTEAYICKFLPRLGKRYTKNALVDENDSYSKHSLRYFNLVLKEYFRINKEFRLSNTHVDELKGVYKKAVFRKPNWFSFLKKTSEEAIYIVDFDLLDKIKLNPDVDLESNFFKKLKSNELHEYYIKHTINRRCRERIIIELRHFIVYLAYRSNGAPKKIANIFEDFVRPMEIKEKNSYITISPEEIGLALHLGFYDLYAINLINYLISPVHLLINTSITEFKDKILVATSFMMDHIFKFHRSAFSWRDLELMPELVDINKAPELREVIQKILNHLSRIHLLKVDNGIFDYTFTQKLVDEISYLCKINDKESAAFNFAVGGTEKCTMSELKSAPLFNRKKVSSIQNDISGGCLSKEQKCIIQLKCCQKGAAVSVR